MIFEPNLQKGVKKDWLAKPNPRKVELARNSSLQTVFERCKEIYFSSGCAVENLQLADSSGMIIEVQKESWVLETFYNENNYQASRHKLFVMLNSEEQKVCFI